MKSNNLALVIGALSILLGLRYFLYPEAEAEVFTWAMLSMAGGVVSCLAAYMDLHNKALIALGTMGYALLAIGQSVAVWAWFNMPMITDSEEGLISWAERFMFLPHFIAILLCMWMIRKLVTKAE